MDRLCGTLRTVIFLTMLLLAAAPVQGQAIPDHIPDDETESLDEERKERFKERNRGWLSQFFTRSSIGTSLPTLSTVAGLTGQAAAGFELGEGDAVYGSLSWYLFALPGEEGSAWPFDQAQDVYVASMHYEKSLRALFADDSAGRRLSVAFGLGGLLGPVSGLNVSVAPQYTVPVNRYWSLPLGVNLSGTVLSEDARFFSIGVQAGVKLHFGRYEKLK